MRRNRFHQTNPRRPSQPARSREKSRAYPRQPLLPPDLIRLVGNQVQSGNVDGEGQRPLVVGDAAGCVGRDEDTGGNPDEFLLRYNIGGIHINAAAFQKLQTEISLQAYDLDVPMIWNNTTVRVYAGVVPLG